MAARSPRPKFVVIVGPTASGKSDLAIRVAKEFNGEIISADSLTIYKKMDIGTAKPTKSEQKAAMHWGFDLVGPRQRFTAADFKRYAEARIADIRTRNRLPIVVGGTGLYIDALVFDFSFGQPAQPGQRQKLNKMSTEQLQKKIKEAGYPMPDNHQNRRHLIRTIERAGQAGGKAKRLPAGVIMVGLLPPDKVLKNKISRRVDKMFRDGLMAETKALASQYGSKSLLAKAKVAYGPVIELLADRLSQEEAAQGLKIAHWQYARRQKTWFRRNKFIQWFDSTDLAQAYIKEQLNT